MKLIVLFLLTLLLGCASSPPLTEPLQFTSNDCRMIFGRSFAVETEYQLDLITELFRANCYSEVVSLGNFIREQRRDKFYSVSGEVAEIFTPEGTFSPYVLESYERSFLTLLISISHLHLGKEDSALAELRRSIQEDNAIIYNHGTDPVMTLLQASLWDRFDTSLSRPLWQRLSETNSIPTKIRKFSKSRIEQIDLGDSSRITWSIYGLGELPDLDWHANFFNNERPYRIRPRSSFPESCSSDQSLLMSTSSWTDKIASKYDMDYHPLLFAKSLFRLPIGLGYGLIGFSTGAAVGAGGCIAATKAEDGAAELCMKSIEAASYIISKSGQLVDFTLAPDLRRWRKLPLAFLITKSKGNEDDPCFLEPLTYATRTTFVE